MSRLRKVVCRALRAHWNPSDRGCPHPQQSPRLRPSHVFPGVLLLLALARSLSAQTAPMDFGDAPAPYPTSLSADGARHSYVQGIFLGAGVTVEPDGQPSPDAGL